MEPGLFHVFQASRSAGNETTCTCALNCFDIYPRVLGQKRLERIGSVPPRARGSSGTACHSWHGARWRPKMRSVKAQGGRMRQKLIHGNLQIQISQWIIAPRGSLGPSELLSGRNRGMELLTSARKIETREQTSLHNITAISSCPPWCWGTSNKTRNAISGRISI